MQNARLRILALTLVFPLLLSACATAPADSASSAPAASKAGSALTPSGTGASEIGDISEADASVEDESSATATSDASQSSAGSSQVTSSKTTSSKTTSSKTTSSKTTSSKATSSKATSSAKASSTTSSKTTSSAKASSATSSTAAATFKLPFKKGMNINRMEGNAYSTSSWSQTYYLGLDSTYSDIKAKGFDYVRFPVCLSKYYDASKDALRTSGSYSIANVDKVITKAINAGLYIILDFHDWDFNGSGAVFAANNADQRTLFVKIWTRIAERYKNHSDKLVFELINEPAKSTSSAANLNLAQNAAIKKIRETNPTRIILATITDASQPWLLTNNNGAESLKLDPGTTRVGLVIHCYNPGVFTHQGMTWANPSYTSQVRLTDAHRSTLRWDLDQIKKYMAAHPDIPINLNEFSVGHTVANTDDVTEYLSTVRSFCEENGIPWGYWQYIGNEMGARASYNGSWYSYVLKGLGLQ